MRRNGQVTWGPSGSYDETWTAAEAFDIFEEDEYDQCSFGKVGKGGKWAPSFSQLNNFDNRIWIPYQKIASSPRQVRVRHVYMDENNNEVLLQNATNNFQLGTSNGSSTTFYSSQENGWNEVYTIEENDKMSIKPLKGQSITENSQLYKLNVGKSYVSYSSAPTTTFMPNYLSSEEVNVDEADPSDNSKDYVYITYVYEVKQNQVYVKHVDEDTKEALDWLGGREGISNFIGISPETNDSSEYQSKFSYSADGVTEGPIEIPSEFNASNSYTFDIPGKGVYEYQGYEQVVSDSLTNATNGLSLKAQNIGDDSSWLPASTQEKVIVLVFYYKKSSITTSKIRELYVSNVDVDGNKINVDSMKILNGINEDLSINISPQNNVLKFQHKYVLGTGSTIDVSSSNNPVIGSDTYECVGYKAVSLNDDDNMLTDTKEEIRKLGNNTKVVKDNASSFENANLTGSKATIRIKAKPNEEDVMAIIFFYQKKNIIINNLSPLELVGKLDFINTDEYNSTTVRILNSNASNLNDADYIPAFVDDEEWISPYVNGAYPYIVRGLKYSESQNSIKMTINVTLKASYTEATTKTISTPTGSVTVASVKSGTKSQTYNCTTKDYILHYYTINNFGMYKIKDLTVTDSSKSSEDMGGKLYNATSNNEASYTIDTSSTYKNKFKGNNGIKDREFNLSCSSSNVTIRSTQTSEADATSYVSQGENNAKNLANGKVTIRVVSSNDYVVLDGKEDMLNRNFKNEQITSNVFDGKTIYATYCNYLGNLINYMKPSNKTTYSDFNIDSSFKISNEADNGVRLLRGKLEYTKVTDSNFDRGTNSGFQANAFTYDTTGNQTINMTGANFANEEKMFNNGNKYKVGEEGNKEVRKVNVFTPISLKGGTDVVKSDVNIVNASVKSSGGVDLQQGVKFTVTPKVNSYYYGNSVNYSKFVDKYYVLCDFETTDASSHAQDPYYVYEVSPGASIELTPTNNNYANALTNTKNNILVIAIAKNAPNNIKTYLNGTLEVYKDHCILPERFEKLRDGTTTGDYAYISYNSNTPFDNDKEDPQSTGSKLSVKRYGAANHIVCKNITTNNVSRIYDFRITDCTDLAFKEVFRGDNNQHNGNKYYSGINQSYDVGNSNLISIPRSLTSPIENIVPLGPYKNITNNNYVSAPKLGYRFSFDMKTTGNNKNQLDTRKIYIVPRYYYISKDGSKFSNDITLYYKNKDGKYKKLSKYILKDINGNYELEKGSDYNIYFKPADGYRLIYDLEDTSNLSNRLKKLNISNTERGNVNYKNAPIVLDKSMMTYDSSHYNGFVQSWYGEFKLPNSTIAVDNSDSNSTINNPLNDGYIGVIFDIYCEDSTGQVIFYSKNNKNGSGTNISQWDYEGYLGVAAGTTASIKIQLEKGNWQIDDTRYNQIKGTVILYDTDARAANDFN